MSWYFSGPHDGEGAVKGSHDGFFDAIKIFVRYHLGTVAFGSLIIAIVQMMRCILAYIQRKYGEKAGAVGRFVMKCCQCCLWCLEKCLKYINKNGYIMCNIHGYGFCKSACKAFFTLLNNLLLVAAVNGIGFLVLSLAKLMICAGVALFGYAIMYDNSEVNGSLWVILLFCAFVGWSVADAFMDLYGTAIDTILMCFLEDKKYNDGQSTAKRYHCGRSLQKFLHGAATDLNHSIKHPKTGEEESVYGKAKTSSMMKVSEV